LLDPFSFPRFQVKGVFLHLFDDVLLLDLPLEPVEGILYRLALLKSDLCQNTPPSLVKIPPTSVWLYSGHSDSYRSTSRLRTRRSESEVGPRQRYHPRRGHFLDQPAGDRFVISHCRAASVASPRALGDEKQRGKARPRLQASCAQYGRSG